MAPSVDNVSSQTSGQANVERSFNEYLQIRKCKNSGVVQGVNSFENDNVGTIKFNPLVSSGMEIERVGRDSRTAAKELD